MTDVHWICIQRQGAEPNRVSVAIFAAYQVRGRYPVASRHANSVLPL